MTTFKVTIPNNKKTFFLELLKLMGAQYEEQEVDFKLSKQQKHLLDEQENLDISEYQDHDEFLKELRKEYGL